MPERKGWRYESVMELEPILEVFELVLYDTGFADGDFKFEVAKFDLGYVLRWGLEEGRRELHLGALKHLSQILLQMEGYSQWECGNFSQGCTLAPICCCQCYDGFYTFFL